ncbi:hypothetical protein LK12_19120 [Novosphingobium malaysiense]|uniref:Uncharacterized protein n=2 Tax=Novosphingobium malaysiense TaxID=1348853 RepID=A0A0B1ZLD4_9SPHN|nr:hypothetical protein LK12_19120 [Novosphingobium malaysiense]
MEGYMMIDRNDAAGALGAVQDARGRLASIQDSACPAWRHIAFGLVEAILVLGFSAHGLLTYILYALALAMAFALMRRDKRRTGLRVNGWRRGRTLVLSIALCVSIIGLGIWARMDFQQPFPTTSGLVAAAIALAMGTLGSVWWQRIYLAELREQAGA